MERVYVGIDWGKEFHAACVVDQQGAKILELPRIEHDREGIEKLIAKLKDLATRFEVRIGIETPRGRLVSMLLAAAFTLFAIHPNKIKAARPRYSSAEGKCDRFDAYLIADVLRTDGHRFTVLAPETEITSAVRCTLSHRDDLSEDLTRSLNRLHDGLADAFPAAATLFADLDGKVALAFLERWPTTELAKDLSQAKLATFLKKNRYSGSKTPEGLFAHLSQGISGVGGVFASASADCIRDMVHLVRMLRDQVDQAERRIEDLLDQHPDTHLYESLPRTRALTIAGLIVALGDDRNRFPAAAVLAADAGVAPVHRSSGKGPPHNAFRRACNKRSRLIFTRLADQSRRIDGWAMDMYKAARARGKRHPEALRIVGKSWAFRLWHVWHDRTPFDPTRGDHPIGLTDASVPLKTPGSKRQTQPSVRSPDRLAS